jgi:acetate kinase
VKVLVLNSGSSSQKSSLYQFGDTLPDLPSRPLSEGKIEWREDSASLLTIASSGSRRHEELRAGSRAEAVGHLVRALWQPDGCISSPSEIAVVGHRVVHGGPKYDEPVLVTPAVKQAISQAGAFAPLHNRAELEGMDVVERLLGPVPQVAVFDTGFHRNLPAAAAVYPGPYEWFESGIHRYGFHGINHQYCAERAAQLLGRDLRSLRLVSCHLGNGCSLAAIRNGHSVDTTMGFTPLEGLMMGTRSGSIDPGILTYLVREGKLKPAEIDDVLNRRSGLLGISGISGDMRDVLAAMKQGHARARLAFEIYLHRLQSAIGGMVASLAGMDALIFTGGVGENSLEVREHACGDLGFLGLKLDMKANAAPGLDQDIAAPGSTVRVLVIRAQEDWAIARECWKLSRAVESEPATPPGEARRAVR